MPRMGRNDLDAPAKNRVVVMLTDEQIQELEKCCWELRWTMTDVIREGIHKVFTEVNKDESDR